MKLATRKTETQEMRAPHLQTGHHVICISQKDITTEIYHRDQDISKTLHPMSVAHFVSIL